MSIYGQLAIGKDYALAVIVSAVLRKYNPDLIVDKYPKNLL